RSTLQESQRWIAAHLRADLSVMALAHRAGVSPRHFSRMFRGELGVTPADYVESVRVDAARRLLEKSTGAPKQVADYCGFTNVNGLRRAFLRCVGITPAEYRKRYAPGLRTEAPARPTISTTACARTWPTCRPMR